MTWRTVTTVWWSAEKQAKEQAEAAVLDVLAPLCVARFDQDAERDAKLAALQKEHSWQRDDFVMKQGWATMPGSEHPGTGVAAACASRILAAHRS